MQGGYARNKGGAGIKKGILGHEERKARWALGERNRTGLVQVNRTGSVLSI